MFVYTTSTARATKPAFPVPSAQHRTAVAHSAVYEHFRPEDARHIDQTGFVDRQPDQPPRLLGQKSPTRFVSDTGMKSLRFWLAQAAQAESEEERDEARRIAGRIANPMGLDADQIDPRAL